MIEYIHQNPFATAVNAREETFSPGSLRTAQRRLKHSVLNNSAAVHTKYSYLISTKN